MLAWLFRSRETGRFTILQIPNTALALWAVCRIAEALLSPQGHALQWAGTAALAWWAIEEVARGVNPFRRLLGAVVLLSILL